MIKIKTLWHKLTQFIFAPMGNVDDYPLEVWAFRFVCYGGFIMTTVKATTNFFTINHLFQPLATYVYALFLYINFRNASSYNYVRIAYYVMVLGTLLFFSVNWFLTEGSKGGILMLFPVGFSFILFTAKNGKFIYTPIIFIVNLGFLFLAEHLFPESFVQRSLFYSNTWRIIDYTVTMMVTFPALTILISYALYCYNREKEKEQKSKKALLDSISYAALIQKSFLNQRSSFKKCYVDYFLISRPKSVISGDFYWHHCLPEGGSITAIGNSAGSGVPGAMMTVLMITLLNQLVIQNRITQIDLLIKELDAQLCESLKIKLKNSTSNNKSGLFLIARTPETIHWLSFNTQAWILHKEAFASLPTHPSAPGSGSSFIGNVYPNSVPVQDAPRFWICTPGLIEQGELKTHNANKAQTDLLTHMELRANLPLAQQKQLWEQDIDATTVQYPQQDDITLLCLQV
jgi:hypothetical protein